MTRDQIIQWAREAELAEPRDDASTLPAVYVAALERFAQLASADEREACAKVADNAVAIVNSKWIPRGIAESIRYRTDEE